MSELPTIKIRLEQHFPVKTHKYDAKTVQITALLDTGTAKSLIAATAIPQNFKLHKLNTPWSITNAINQKSQNIIFNELRTNIYFIKQNKKLCDRQFLVVNNPLKWDAIIGMDILKNKTLRLTKIVEVNAIQIQENEKNYKIIKPNKNEKTQEKTKKQDLLIASKYAYLPPFETTHVSCELQLYKSKDMEGKIFNIETSQKLKAENCIVRSEHEGRRNQIQITNLSENPIEIEKETVLGYVIPDNQVQFNGENFETMCNALLRTSDLSPHSQKIHQKELQEWKDRRAKLVKEISLSDEVEIVMNSSPQKYQKKFKILLTKYDIIFARSASDAGFNPNWAVKLTFKEGMSKEPTFSPPYKLERETARLLEIKVNELIEAGILEKTSSSWNSPCIGIKKRGGKQIRLVNNYSSPKDTGVNARLTTTRFPIPSIRNLNQTISSTIARLKADHPTERIMMASLDLRNAFYNIALEDESRDITAFILSDIQVRYRRLSMGLAVSPSEFQMFLHHVFTEQLKPSPEWCFVSYLDDYFCLSTESAHLHALDVFFAKCMEENILLNLSKCSFFQNEVKFLGLIINQKGFEVEKNKVEALMKIPYPHNQKSAQRFLGTFNYFARAIPRLSVLLAPLAEESAKKEYKLTTAIKTGIDRLRSLIKDGIGTHHLDYTNRNDNKVILVVDTSLTQTGFALGNATIRNGTLSNIRLSHFGSKRLDKTVTLLSSRARELIGLSTALETFRDLLPEQLEIHAYIDHQSLKTVKTAKTLGKTSSHTRTRFALANVLNYANLNICYLPNTNYLIELADGLSRVDTIPTTPIETITLDPDFLKDEQKEKTVEMNALEPTTITLKDVEKEQDEDEFLSRLKQRIRDSAMGHITFNGNEYRLQNNNLCIQTKNGKLLTCIPTKMGHSIVNFLHIQHLHPGEERLRTAILNSPIHIPGLRAMIHKATRHCLWCQLQAHTKFPKPKTAIEYKIKPGLKPWATTCIDLMDVSGYGGDKFILSFMDTFSGFTDIQTLKNKSAAELVPKLVLLITKWGLSFNSELVSDNGREFINQYVDDAYKFLGITRRKITAWNSRANSSERVHRELRRLLKPLNPTRKDASFKFQLALNYYNTMPQSRLLGRSPLQMLTGAEPTMYLSQLHPDDQEAVTTFSTDPEEEDFAKWQESLKTLQVNFGVRQIQLYNKTDQPKGEFEIGDIVAVISPNVNLSKTLTNPALGPYMITEKQRNTYVLQCVISQTKIKRNGRFLKRLFLSEEQLAELRHHAKTSFDENRIEPIPEDAESRVNKILYIKDPKSRVESDGYNLRPR